MKVGDRVKYVGDYYKFETYPHGVVKVVNEFFVYVNFYDFPFGAYACFEGELELVE